MDARRIGAIVVVFMASYVSSAQAQLLGRASSAVRGDDGPSASSSRDDDDDDYDDYDDRSPSDDGGLLDRASDAVRERRPSRGYRPAGYVAAGSAGYYAYAGDGSGYTAGPELSYVIGAYPYADGAQGYAVPAEQNAGRTAGVIDVEGGYALGGAGRAMMGARLMLDIPLDLSARYSVFIEPLDAGGIQVAALGRAGLAWRAVDVPALQARIGGGVRHFQDGAGGMFGVDVELGADIFPGAPWVIRVDGTIGFVGQAMVAQVRASVGVVIDLMEIYAGYDYEGLVAGEHVDLGGPMLGVRAWL